MPAKRTPKGSVVAAEPWRSRVKACLKGKQRSAAARLGVNEGQITRYLDGAHMPIEHIETLSTLTAVPLDLAFKEILPVGAETPRPGTPLQRNLMTFRSEMKMSPREAADAAGIDPNVLLAYEDGNAEISGQHLLALADVYERDPKDFERDPPPPRKTKPAPAVHAKIVGQIDDFTPENRARLLELQREALAINAAERKLLEEQKKPKKR